MSTQAATWTVIGLTSVLAFGVRALFIVAPRLHDKLPRSTRAMLELVPPAALAALVVPALVRPSGTAVAWPDAAAMAAAGLAGLVWKRSAVTIGVGIAAICLLRYALGVQ